MTQLVDAAFLARLTGASLVTAHILYRMPDYLHLLQEFIWQDHDVAPGFPRLKEFLRFWHRELDGPLYHVTVCHDRLVRPVELTVLRAEFRLQ